MFRVSAVRLICMPYEIILDRFGSETTSRKDSNCLLLGSWSRHIRGLLITGF